MAGTYNADTIFLVTAQVTAVNAAAGRCTVEAISGRSSTSIDNVEFQAVVSDGLLFIPRVGSEVKVLMSTYTEPFIVQYSEVEKAYISADLIQFNDGALGGLVKVIELTQKLNTLENDINDLKAKFQSLVTTITIAAGIAPAAPVTNGTALGWFNPFLAYATQQITPTQQADIENPVITQ
jgi:hypothetical protein